MAPGGPVHRQRRHRLVTAAPRQHATLLQRDRVLRHARGRLAQVPVPRPGEDHPVRNRHARVREVHGADRGGGDVAAVTRAVAVIDGEHYAPVVRDAIAGLPYEVVGAWLAGGTEKLRGGDDYGVPLLADLEDGWAAAARRSRSLPPCSRRWRRFWTCHVPGTTRHPTISRRRR